MSYYDSENFECDGRRYSQEDIEDSWDIDLGRGDYQETLPESCDSVDQSRCGSITLLKTNSQDFLLWWQHRHPEMLSDEEILDLNGVLIRTEDVGPEYLELERALPPETLTRKISRREAYELIARVWLPEEFHQDAGV